MKAPATTSKAARGPVALLVATKKGAFMLKADRARRSWKQVGTWFLGHVVHHVVPDPRDRRTLLVAARTGHLGPTVFRSTDLGKHWKEAAKPPAFAEAPEGQQGRVVDHVFWLTPGHASEPGVWHAGSTSPHGLFRVEDGGEGWQPISGFNDHPQRTTWNGGGQGGTPDGPKLRMLDEQDAFRRHIRIFVNGEQTWGLATALRPGDAVHILQALSDG